MNNIYFAPSAVDALDVPGFDYGMLDATDMVGTEWTATDHIEAALERLDRTPSFFGVDGFIYGSKDEPVVIHVTSGSNGSKVRCTVYGTDTMSTFDSGSTYRIVAVDEVKEWLEGLI